MPSLKKGNATGQPRASSNHPISDHHSKPPNCLERGAGRPLRLTWLSSQNLQTNGAEKSLSQNTEKSTESAEDVHEIPLVSSVALQLCDDSMRCGCNSRRIDDDIEKRFPEDHGNRGRGHSSRRHFSLRPTCQNYRRWNIRLASPNREYIQGT